MNDDARDSKKNFVITKDPIFYLKYMLRPINEGAVQATLNKLSDPNIALRVLNNYGLSPV